MLSSPLVRYKHRKHDCGSEASVTDIPAGSVPQLQMCLQLLQKSMLAFDVPSGRVQLSQTCLLFHGYRNMPECLVKLLRTWPGVLVLDMCAGSIPHNQICVMVKMSVDPVAIMAGLLA